MEKCYTLYIDECGDPVLATYDYSFPIFTLCGVLVPNDRADALKQSFDDIKNEFWGDTSVILHSRDIRKCQKQFQILFDNDIKQRFYKRINEALSGQGAYIIISCCVLKRECIEQYGVDADVYGTALKYVLQRSIFCVDDIDGGGSKISIVAERRGKKEDAALRDYYERLRISGMHYVDPVRFANHIVDFNFIAKKDNVIGLQVADLIAYPISRYVLNPSKANLSYEVIKPNIYSSGGKLLGLKMFPDK